jgi:hypothetical protein
MVQALVRPSSNDTQGEQLFGRLHRPGQDSDVTFDLMLGCRDTYLVLESAHAEARWSTRPWELEQKISTRIRMYLS